MSYQEIVLHAKHLTLQEQVMLVEELMRDIRQSVMTAHVVQVSAVIPFHRLRGSLKVDATAMFDTENTYIEHLLEKYL